MTASDKEHGRLYAAFPFSEQSFEDAALDVFRFQAKANLVYASWLQALKINRHEVKTLVDIPFFPIELFKSHSVTSLPNKVPLHTFYSSRTTGQTASKNFVFNFELYQQSSIMAFEAIFGPLSDYQILSLLPSYSQTGESSLVCMVHHFAKVAGQEKAVKLDVSLQSLHQGIEHSRIQGKRPLVFGVTHALLELAHQGVVEEDFLLIETGGMKGRGPELTRPELHHELSKAFPNADIRSEYGMTELFSQGYTNSHKSEVFILPPWCRASLRDETDPLSTPLNRNRGLLTIIDLANIDSCAFLATNDVAEITKEGIKILGRADHAEIRGCNLLTL
jgi:hypothetical protein